MKMSSATASLTIPDFASPSFKLYVAPEVYYDRFDAIERVFS